MSAPRPCDRCGVEYTPQRSRTRFCSRACAGVLPNEPENIWRFIRRGAPGECWEWSGTVDSHGYGRISIRRKGMLAHRLAYELSHGEPAGDMLVCHRCDNRRCCNPAHLFLGTPADNLGDAARKGRMLRGEACPAARLTEDIVREIRRLAAAGIAYRTIADRFGTSPPNVRFICRRVTWRHIA